MQRTGQLLPNSSRTATHLKRAITDLNLHALDTNDLERGSFLPKQNGRAPFPSSTAAPRRGSLSVVRQNRPRNSRKRLSYSPADHPISASGEGEEPYVNQNIRRATVANDARARRQTVAGVRRISSDKPPTLTEVDSKEEIDNNKNTEGQQSRNPTVHSHSCQTRSKDHDNDTTEPARSGKGNHQLADTLKPVATKSNQEVEAVYTQPNLHPGVGHDDKASYLTHLNRQKEPFPNYRNNLNTTVTRPVLTSMNRISSTNSSTDDGLHPTLTSVLSTEELGIEKQSYNSGIISGITPRRRSGSTRRSFSDGTNDSVQSRLPSLVRPPSHKSAASSHHRANSASTMRRLHEMIPFHKDPPPIKTIRSPLNKRAISSKQPSEIFQELLRAVKALDLPHKIKGMALICRCDGVRLEAEVVRIAGLSMHSVHMLRLRGDLERYTQLYTLILNEMNL